MRRGFNSTIVAMPARFARRVWFLLLAASTTLAACAGNRAMSPQPATMRVERASADDCAILVAIGKSELKWGAKPPAAAFLPEFSMPGGGTYRQGCSWNELGVAPPTIGDSRSPMAFFITRPTYAGPRATAYFQYTVAALRLPDGSLLPPFLERERCSLEKRAGEWHLLSCKISRIGP
ncbi:MAG: hypothetical protein ACREHF_08580 [Rhizomicrobium sp.]